VRVQVPPSPLEKIHFIKLFPSELPIGNRQRWEKFLYLSYTRML
jgi:hypothetical protein